MEDKTKKLELWLSFVKFILGTVVLGFITQYINSDYQDRKLEVEKIQRDNEYIAKFLSHALDKDLEKRRDFAEYFYRLSTSENSRKGWGAYKVYVEEQITKANLIEKEKREIENRLASELKSEKSKNSKLISELRLKVTDKESELNSLRSTNDKFEQKYLAALFVIEKVKKYGGKDAARIYFTSNFDIDKSGKIDTLYELERITCNNWSIANIYLPPVKDGEEGTPFSEFADTLGISEKLMSDVIERTSKCENYKR